MTLWLLVQFYFWLQRLHDILWYILEVSQYINPLGSFGRHLRQVFAIHWALLDAIGVISKFF